VHLGGAVASSLSRTLELPHKEAALLLACGAGAGIAASFRAPLAGALFALEIVLGDFAVHRFTPIVLACGTATATSRALLAVGSDLRPIAWSLTHPTEIGVYLVLGIVAGFCGVLYVRVIHGAEIAFGRLKRWRPEMRAALGGLIVGAVGLVAPRALGTGIETLNAALGGQLALGALVLALVCKLIATSATLGSGSPGGSFFPAAFIGAMLGGAFGRIAQAALPGIVSGAEAYAAVGMGVCRRRSATACWAGRCICWRRGAAACGSRVLGRRWGISRWRKRWKRRRRLRTTCRWPGWPPT